MSKQRIICGDCGADLMENTGYRIQETELRKPHREICSLCHEVSRVGFWVPDHIWKAAVHRSQINSIICLRCFTRLADERSVPWDEEIKFFPVSWITHSRDVLKIEVERI